MLKYVQLKNVGPAPEMALEFGSRLNLITGDNGLGKSFLLDVAWWALTRKWPRDLNQHLTTGYPAKPTNPKKPATISFSLDSKTKVVSYSSEYSARDESWLGKAGRPWNPGLVVYAHAEGSFSVWDPARNYWKQRGNIYVQDRVPGYVFSPQQVWDGLQVEFEGSELTVCNGLLRDWASWIKESGVDARNMESVLRMLSPSLLESELLSPGPLTRISINDVRDIPSIKTGYSDCVPIVHASSGVRRIVALAYMLLWTWREHRLATNQLGEKPAAQVVLLIDELESHLHPKWQRAILRSLLNLASVMHDSATIQLIAATHSPLVMASAEPKFDPNQDAWFDIDYHPNAKTGKVEIVKQKYDRLGDVSAWLTSSAFDLGDARSLEAEQAIRAAINLSKKKTHPSSEILEVDSQLRSSLGETDRFWVRWESIKDQWKAKFRGMIRVSQADEPSSFNTKVRQPGELAIAEMVGEQPKRSAGRRFNKRAARREDLSASDFPDYWTRCIEDMMSAYSEICAYSCFRIHKTTGSASIDHLAPKSRRWDKVYEWSNYRLCCSLMNARKNFFEDVIDPFEVEDHWFQLELLGFEVIANPKLKRSQRTLIDATILG